MYRIFVVEDDRTIAQEVCRLAESWGLEARCARDLRAVTEEARLFVEAPTGVGKTISTVFPAVKAMGEEVCDRIFYLTAKTLCQP